MNYEENTRTPMKEVEDRKRNSDGLQIQIPPKQEEGVDDASPEDSPVKDEEYYKRLMKEKEEEEIKHVGRKLWFSKILVHYTWVVITLSLAFIIILTILTVALGGFDLADQGNRDYLIWDAKEVEEYDMLELTKEKIQTNYPNGIQPLRTTSMQEWTTSVMFECKDCNTILTADFIKQMYEIEQKVVSDANYKNYCKAVSSSNSACSTSAYSSFAKNFATNINTLTQADVDTYLNSIKNDQNVYLSNNIFLESSFSRTNLVSKKARAIFVMAGPIEVDGKRYKTYSDDESGQEEKFVDFSYDIEEKVKNSNTKLTVRFYNTAWFNEEINKLVMKDFALAILSFTFVLIYVSFHLKSIFLAVVSMLAIAFSYPLSIFFTKFIFQISYFQTLNFVAVFVILGISADNVFVFTDAWEQSLQYELLNQDKENKYNNLESRMNYTWRRASKAIFTTSFTTCMAFIATGVSKIMPISAFGYFAAVLVAINYLFAITTYPACLILFEKYLAHRCKYRKYIGLLCTKMFSKW